MPSALSSARPRRLLGNRPQAACTMRALGRSLPGAALTGGHGYEPLALYLQPICSRERILIRADNQITAGRERGALRIEKLAADTRPKCPDLLEDYGDIAEWAKSPIAPKNWPRSLGRGSRYVAPDSNTAESKRSYAADRRQRAVSRQLGASRCAIGRVTGRPFLRPNRCRIARITRLQPCL